MHTKTKAVFKCISFIMVGWLLGQICENIALFRWDTEISIMNVTSLLVTIFLAFYVANILEKGVQDKRFEKNLIINKIDEAEKSINKLSEIIYNEQDADKTYQFKQIVYLISLTQKDISRYWKLISHHYKIKHNCEGDKIESNIKSNIANINNLCTYTPISGENDDISISNGSVTYSDQRINEIIILLDKIKEDLNEMKLFINSK